MRISSGHRKHSGHYHDFLLKHLPSPCVEALDVGCGTGTFSRLLAQRYKRVLALDLSPKMIQVAQEHSKPYTNIDFRVADATTWQFPAERFDGIVGDYLLLKLSHRDKNTMMNCASMSA